MSFDRWVGAVRTLGLVRVVASKAHLDVIDEEDLRTRVKKGYQWERRAYLTAMKDTPIPTKNRQLEQEVTDPANASSAASASASGTSSGAMGTAPSLEDLAIMSTSNRQSHQRTVSENTLTV